MLGSLLALPWARLGGCLMKLYREEWPGCPVKEVRNCIFFEYRSPFMGKGLQRKDDC